MTFWPARASWKASSRPSRIVPSSPARPRGRVRIIGSSRRPATSPHALSRWAQENRAALLFGSERYGLATEDLNLCNVLVRIPANPEYCSLNLAMSVQLAAYEIFMAREQPQSHTQLEMALAPSGDVEHFYAHLHEVLNEIDFADRTGHLMERLRRLFNRAQLDRNELNILRGILSAVQGRRGQSAQRSRK